MSSSRSYSIYGSKQFAVSTACSFSQVVSVLFFFSFSFCACQIFSPKKMSHNSPHVVGHISHESLCLTAGCGLMTLTVKKTPPLHRLSVRCVREVRLPSGALIGTAFVSPDTDHFILSSFFFLSLSLNFWSCLFSYRSRTLCHG